MTKVAIQAAKLSAPQLTADAMHMPTSLQFMVVGCTSSRLEAPPEMLRMPVSVEVKPENLVREVQNKPPGFEGEHPDD